MVPFLGPDGILGMPSWAAMSKILLDYLHRLLRAYAPPPRSIDYHPFVIAGQGHSSSYLPLGAKLWLSKAFLPNSIWRWLKVMRLPYPFWKPKPHSGFGG
jgi:hypothetical protein